MKITVKWLNKHAACDAGRDWFLQQKEVDVEKVVLNLWDEGHYDWANWALKNCLSKKKLIQYAIFAAEQVIDIYEKRYPEDRRVRNAIDTAKLAVKNPTRKNKGAAYAAANAAYAAAHAANAAYAAAHAANAAYAAAYAANAAYAAAYVANAAYAAANAAYAAYAAYAAANAAHAANAAYAAAKKEIYRRIFGFGLSLVGRKNV